MKLNQVLPTDTRFNEQHAAWMAREQHSLDGLEVYSAKLIAAIKAGNRQEVIRYLEIVRSYSRRLSIAVSDFPSKESW